MASGRLGAVDLAATTWTTAYQVPSAKVGSFTVSICNRNATSVVVRMALTTTAPPSTPGVTEYLEYDVAIPANGILERSGLVADANKYLAVYSNTANVSVVTMGYEE